MRLAKIFLYSFLLFFLCIFTIIDSAIAAYEFGTVYIQYRHNEDGSEYNRLYFEVKDDSGNWISDGNIVTDVKLFDPNDKLVSLSGSRFGGLIDIIPGRFNLASGQWEYDSSFPISGFYYNFSEHLISGAYLLVVTTSDEQILAQDYAFNQQVDNFPYFSSKSFEIYHDSDGNVYWNWDIPEAVVQTAESHATSVRAFVDVYDGDQETAILWPTVPTHMGSLFIPYTVVQELASKGDTFKFIVSFRTNDNQNRSYSKAVTVTDMLTTVSKKRQVVVVPMF
jgi:hypothetical protein